MSKLDWQARMDQLGELVRDRPALRRAKDGATGRGLAHLYVARGAEASTKVLKPFVAAGYDFSNQDSTGNSALHLVMHCRSKEEALHLLLEECRVRLNDTNADGDTPLHLYVRNGPVYPATVRLYVESQSGSAKFDVNSVGAEQETVLHTVLANFPRLDLTDETILELAKLFVDAGFDLAKRSARGTTVLEQAEQVAAHGAADLRKTTAFLREAALDRNQAAGSDEDTNEGNSTGLAQPLEGASEATSSAHGEPAG